VQRAKDANADAIFVFVPGGAQPAALTKAMAERGITPANTKILGQGEIALDDALQNIGDAAVGITTVFHYDENHETRSSSRPTTKTMAATPISSRSAVTMACT
jgi:branched-chain amino acid transport system substrate-binding protein